MTHKINFYEFGVCAILIKNIAPPPPFKNTIIYFLSMQHSIIFLYHDTMQAEMASKITTQKSSSHIHFTSFWLHFSQLSIDLLSLLDSVPVLSI